MRSYKISCFHKPLTLVEEADPNPQGTEVLLAVDRCGICHSDLYVQDGRINLGGGKYIDLADRGIEPPITLGHEIQGTIVAQGPDAVLSPELKGVPVIAYPWLGCCECELCLDGNSHLCDKPSALGISRSGGYATACVIPHARYLVPASGIEPSFAAILACSGLTAYSAIKKLTAHGINDDLLIIGAGGLGLLALQVARALGFTRVGVADVSADKRKAAISHGANYVIDTNDQAALTIAHSTSPRIKSVVDFVGADETASFALTALAKGGAYVVVGLYGGSVDLKLPLLVQRSIAVMGSYVGSIQELFDVVELARSGALKPIPIEEISLSEASDGLARLRVGKVDGRLVLRSSGV